MRTEAIVGKAVLKILSKKGLKEKILGDSLADWQKLSILSGVIEDVGKVDLGKMNAKDRNNIIGRTVNTLNSYAKADEKDRAEMLKQIDEVAKISPGEIAVDALMNTVTESTKAGADISRTIGSGKAKAKSILAQTTTAEQENRYGKDLLANALLSLAIKDDITGNVVGSGLNALGNIVDKTYNNVRRGNEIVRQNKLAVVNPMSNGAYDYAKAMTKESLGD